MFNEHIEAELRAQEARISELEYQVFGDKPRFASAPCLVDRIDGVLKALNQIAEAAGVEYFYNRTPAVPEKIESGFRKIVSRKTKKSK